MGILKGIKDFFIKSDEEMATSAKKAQVETGPIEVRLTAEDMRPSFEKAIKNIIGNGHYLDVKEKKKFQELSAKTSEKLITTSIQVITTGPETVAEYTFLNQRIQKIKLTWTVKKLIEECDTVSLHTEIAGSKASMVVRNTDDVRAFYKLIIDSLK